METGDDKVSEAIRQWWLTPLNPALRQVDLSEFEVSPVYEASSGFRRKGDVFIPCLKVQACSLLRTLGSNICPVSMAVVDTDQLFLRTKRSSEKRSRRILKAPAVSLNHPLSQMQVHLDQAQRGRLWVA